MKYTLEEAINWTLENLTSINFKNPDIKLLKQLAEKSEQHCNEILKIADEKKQQIEKVKQLEKSCKAYKFSAVALAIGGFVVMLAILLTGLAKNWIQPEDKNVGTMILLMSPGIAMLLSGVLTVFTVDKPQALVRSLNLDLLELQNASAIYFTFNSLMKTTLDKEMYKAVYESVYKVQEHLRENDKKGFKAFEKAFNDCEIDVIELLKTYNDSMGKEKTV